MIYQWDDSKHNVPFKTLHKNKHCSLDLLFVLNEDQYEHKRQMYLFYTE